MLIILEGPDGAGKTTLALDVVSRIHASRRRHGVTLLHRGPLRAEALEEYVLDLNGYLPAVGTHVVADRWHVGELIYGPLLRGVSQLDDAQAAYVEMFLQSRGAVVALPDFNRAAGVIQERGDDLVDGGMLDAIIDGYTAWQRTTTLPIVHELDTPTDFADRIITAASKHARDVEHLHPRYVGTRWPSTLLVGDVSSPRQGVEWGVPFVPLGGTSGHFLLQALPPEERRVTGLVNAHELTRDELRILIQQLGHPRVVALGTAAHDTLDRYGLPHGAVPHPKYARRITYHKRERYADLIRHAALGREDLRRALRSAS